MLKQIKIINYLGYIIVLITSFLAASYLPIEETFKGIVSFPGIGALFLLLHKLWQEDRNRQYSLELRHIEQDFVLGTASHMAKVVYDKHVIFCEEYVIQVQQGFNELLQSGATKKTMDIGSSLVRIRLKHSTWLTEEIEKELKPFETALINIGVKEHALEYTTNKDDRTKIIDEIYRSFGLILGNTKPLNDEEVGMARDEVIERIRKILGINVLTTLRKKTADVALERIKKTN